MNPQVSKSVGPLFVSEFVDPPGSKPASAAGATCTASAGVGLHVVDEFLDQVPGGEQPAHRAPRIPLDAKASAAATALYDRAVTIYEQLVWQEGRSDLASELSRARSNKAVAVRELGTERAAVALTDQAMALYERLVEQEGRQDLANDLATIYKGKATTLLALGDVDRARAYHNKAVALSTSCQQGSP